MHPGAGTGGVQILSDQQGVVGMRRARRIDVWVDGLIHIDSAFQRRMDVVVDFRPPEVPERLRLWQLHLPADHDVGSELLRELSSRCVLTGGQIRNAVLHAAVVAHAERGPLGDDRLVGAVQREYRKSGAVCPLRSK